MTRLVIGTLLGLLLLSGCRELVSVEVTAEGNARLEQSQLKRFAVTHYTATHERQAQLMQRVDAALQANAAAARLVPLNDQRPMQTGLAKPKLLGAVGEVVTRRMRRAGYATDTRDPQMLISVDCLYGPYAVRNPMSGAVGRATVHAVAMHVYASGGELDRPIWSGTAISVCAEPRFAVMAPYLIAELVEAFPRSDGEVQIVRIALPDAD